MRLRAEKEEGLYVYLDFPLLKMAEPAQSKPEPLNVIIGMADTHRDLTVLKELQDQGFSAVVVGSKDTLREKVKSISGAKLCFISPALGESVLDLALNYIKTGEAYCEIVSGEEDVISKARELGLHCTSEDPIDVVYLIDRFVYDRFGC